MVRILIQSTRDLPAGKCAETWPQGEGTAVDNQQGLAEVNRTQLHYQIAGTGDSVVLIHGLGADLRIWDAQFPVFAQRYRVLRYDIRGHGKSGIEKYVA